MGCGRYYERFVRLRDMRWASEESRSVAGAAKDFSGAGSRHFALVDHGNAVDQHIVHSLRKLIGIVEGGEIADRSGIENRDIRPHAHAQKAAALDAQALRRKRGEFADGVFKRELVLFADVFAENARESSVSSRMCVFPAQDSLG